MAVKVGSSGWSLRVKRPGSPERVFPISVNWSFEGKAGHAHSFVGRPGGGVAEFGAAISIRRDRMFGDRVVDVSVGGSGSLDEFGYGRSVKGAVEDWASRAASRVANGDA